MSRFFFILAGAVGGYQAAARFGWPGFDHNKNFAIIIYMIIGSALGYVAGGIVGRRISRTLAWIEETIDAMPVTDLVLGVGGLVMGLVIAFLATLPLSQVQIPALRLLLFAGAYAALVWLGIKLAVARRDDFRGILPFGPVPTSGPAGAGATGDKLLDTNIIIDGRIIDVMATGFLDGRLVLPRFVLQELHTISDSHDALKRQRGRRGLDILNELRDKYGSKVEIAEKDYADIIGVDAKLVRLAQETGAAIMTNDYNLNKVAQLEGVEVINLNDLSNALRPVVLPGEEMSVRIVHEGKEPGQGVGYLEDGTMVVVEDGAGCLGEDVELKVTSMLQTSAGKMIFSKMKLAGSA